MPEVLRVDGYIVKIWFNDHPPQHVHVFKDNGECVIELNNQGGTLHPFYCASVGLRLKQNSSSVCEVH